VLDQESVIYSLSIHSNGYIIVIRNFNGFISLILWEFVEYFYH